jgi:hypothetical protein
MTPAMHLNQSETKKISDKSSVAYKALMTVLRELRDRTGLKFSVIGTDSKGSLFEVDIDE